ncbi:MAG: MAPEG family protein [Alphaproteobacteria bacterium]|nr:MAPEG family protein [Alphaproteobacteria bacterium]
MTSAVCLLGYVAWTLLLVGITLALRVRLVLSGRPANTFQPDGEDVSPFAARLSRAHLNCLENLPLVAVVVLLGLVTDHAAITDPLAPWLLGARVAQSSVHLASTSPPAVQARFGFLVAQHGILVVWLVSLGGALTG